MTADVVTLDRLAIPLTRGGKSRRAQLTVERDGSLLLRAAADVGSDELTRFLTTKRDWIYRKLAEKEELQLQPVHKEIVDGEGFSYLGRNYRLKVLDAEVPQVRVDRGRLVLPMSRRRDGGAAVIDWYRRSGLTWLRPRVRDLAARVRVQPDSLEVQDLGFRWGLATADGRVRIHWATLQLQPSLVEYVIAHELVHLREAHHGPAFWQLLERVQPDYAERKARIAAAGREIWLGQ